MTGKEIESLTRHFAAVEAWRLLGKAMSERLRAECDNPLDTFGRYDAWLAENPAPAPNLTPDDLVLRWDRLDELLRASGLSAKQLEGSRRKRYTEALDAIRSMSPLAPSIETDPLLRHNPDTEAGVSDLRLWMRTATARMGSGHPADTALGSRAKPGRKPTWTAEEVANMSREWDRARESKSATKAEYAEGQGMTETEFNSVLRHSRRLNSTDK